MGNLPIQNSGSLDPGSQIIGRILIVLVILQLIILKAMIKVKNIHNRSSAHRNKLQKSSLNLQARPRCTHPRTLIQKHCNYLGSCLGFRVPEPHKYIESWPFLAIRKCLGLFSYLFDPVNSKPHRRKTKPLMSAPHQRQ